MMIEELAKRGMKIRQLENVIRKLHARCSRQHTQLRRLRGLASAVRYLADNLELPEARIHTGGDQTNVV